MEKFVGLASGAGFVVVVLSDLPDPEAVASMEDVDEVIEAWRSVAAASDFLDSVLRVDTSFEEDWLRSMRIFLQMSRSRLAIVRAGTSQRNTWQVWHLECLSLAT